MISIALLSDVHGNLEALDAVLAHLQITAPHAARYHLGDLVGYSANPNEVVSRLDAEAIPGVAGNYDSTVALGYKHCGCRADTARQEELAHESFAWTLTNTTEGTKRRLAALPFRLDIRPLGGHVAGPRTVLLHAHPSNNLVYVTGDRPDDFLRKMGAAVDADAGDVLAFGHTHKPWHRVVDGVHYVNTGSVGRFSALGHFKQPTRQLCQVHIEVASGALAMENHAHHATAYTDPAIGSTRRRRETVHPSGILHRTMPSTAAVR